MQELRGLDVARFGADLPSDRTAAAIATQREVCTSHGARGTPSFFVGSDLLTGAQEYEALAEAVRFKAAED